MANENTHGDFYGPYFSVFGLKTEIYSVNLSIQSEYGKTLTRKTLYLDTFHTVLIFLLTLLKDSEKLSINLFDPNAPFLNPRKA